MTLNNPIYLHLLHTIYKVLVCVCICMYAYVYIYIYIGRTCLVAPIFLLIRMRSVFIQLNTNVIRGLVKRAQLLEHVHNFCETRTTAGKRAQHL